MLNIIFYATNSLNDFKEIFSEAMTSGAIPALIALGFALLFLLFILLIAFYILTSWAFMSLAKKVKYPSPGIAWIPIVGPAIILAKTAKMHWWPILLLIGMIIPLISFAFWIAFYVFFIIWLWKTYEVINKPGWWAIFWIIQPVGLILLCVAAWSKK